MGLYVAKNFTELLGGKIELETELGKGSTFTVRIPRVIIR
ncbi:MAG TPA: ATP-binding protein [Candidatus Binatia bacterium]|nr:ATP-binding protein [Candidatus Binatia bacterium]